MPARVRARSRATEDLPSRGAEEVITATTQAPPRPHRTCGWEEWADPAGVSPVLHPQPQVDRETPVGLGELAAGLTDDAPDAAVRT